MDTFDLFRSSLSSFGIEVLEEVDFEPREMRGHILLRRGRSRQLFTTCEIEPMTISEAKRNASEPLSGAEPLYVGEAITDKSATAFRELGLQFVDRCGNAHLIFGDVYVDVRGRRPSGPAGSLSMKSPSDAAQNLFSRRRAQVIFALLTWPEVATWTLREISEVSGVSLGQAQQTLKQLDSEGFYIDRTSGEILNRRGLFDLWIANYPRYLAPSLKLESFRGEIGEFSGDPDIQLGGESAVQNFLRPASLVMYVHQFTPEMARQNRWRRSSDPNIFLRHKFWTEPWLVRRRPGPLRDNLVPSTLIYADLIASGDARQREVAELLEESDDRLLAITRS